MAFDDFNNSIMKKICNGCNFQFFTHYKNKTLCGSCSMEADMKKRGLNINKWL